MKKFKINFGNDISSEVEENVYKYIVNLLELNKSPRSLPPFFNLSNLIKKYDQELLDFYRFIFANSSTSKSQLFQDLFVLFILKEKRNGTFLEFGATNGIELSNSFLLESNFGWKGLLAEPSPQWIGKLKQNRPKSEILDKCIYSESGKNIDFFVSDVGVLSTIDEFRNSDISSMPGNTKARNANGHTLKVPTISLNDVFKNHLDDQRIDYMSVDTEGSEFLILENFNFKKYAPKVVTVEHNFTNNNEKLNNLFKENNYTRFFSDQSEFDAWYVRND